MSDIEFARRFERGEIRNQDFHHREHLRVAWAYLQEANSAEDACARMCSAIRGFASAAGAPGKYHETMTVFWVRLLALVRERYPAERNIEPILQTHAFLLDKHTPLRYYSRGRLMSDEARLTWHPPDLRPLNSHEPDLDPSHRARYTPDRPISRNAA